MKKRMRFLELNNTFTFKINQYNDYKHFSVFEIFNAFMFCRQLAISLPKHYEQKLVKGKVRFFMMIIILGYAFGIINKSSIISTWYFLMGF